MSCEWSHCYNYPSYSRISCFSCCIFLFFYSPVWWCGEVSDVPDQGGENPPASAALQWMSGQHQNDFTGPLQLLSWGAHWPRHAPRKPVVSRSCFIIMTAFHLRCTTCVILFSRVGLTRVVSFPLLCFPLFLLLSHFYFLFVFLFSVAGTTERSAGQMRSLCSGCARRRATWWETARPARMTTPSPSSKDTSLLS